MTRGPGGLRYARPFMTGKVRLLAFAGARDVIGRGELEIPIAATCSVEELLGQLCARFPALAPHRESLRLAVNGVYVGPADPVASGDEVALIPPVAGG